MTTIWFDLFYIDSLNNTRSRLGELVWHYLIWPCLTYTNNNFDCYRSLWIICQVMLSDQPMAIDIE